MAAGGRWPEIVDNLAVQDVVRVEAERGEGITQQRPHVVLLSDIADVWTDQFVSTEDLLARLIAHNRDMWGATSAFGKELTAQRLGRMLVNNYNIHSDRRPDDRGPGGRGYVLANFMHAFKGLGITLPQKPVKPVEPVEPVSRLPLCKRCGQVLMHPDSIKRGYCAKAECAVMPVTTDGGES